MKNIFYRFLAIAAFVAAVVSCNKTEINPDAEKEAAITVKDAKLAIPADGGSVSFSVKADKAFTAVVDRKWCTVNFTEQDITLTAEANLSLKARYATVLIATATDTLSLTAQQFGTASSGFAPDDILANHEQQKVTYEYSFKHGKMTATSEQDWITVETVDDSKLVISLAENTAASTKGNRFREGSVIWKLGLDIDTISVKQFNAAYLQLEADWTLSYEGIKKDEEGIDIDIVKNTVIAGSPAGTYGIAPFKKSVVEASGLSLSDYIEIYGIQSYVDDVNATIEFYRTLGVELKFEDFLMEGSDVENLYLTENGDWYAVAIGMDTDAEPTGKYAFIQFKREGKDPTLEGYNSWLGEWEVPKGKTTEKWTITAKVKGETFTITGLEGTTYPVTGIYVPASNTLQVDSQTGLATLEDEDGTIDVCVYGCYNNGNLLTGQYSIFTAAQSKDGKTATLTPETLSGQDPFECVRPVGYQAATGKYYLLTKQGTEAAPLPNTITKISGGGGGGTGSEAYNAWIGTWTVASTNKPFDITISENIADESYFVHGWEMNEEWNTMDALYQDGLIGLVASDKKALVTNVSLEDPDDPYDIFAFGSIIYTDGQEYFITGEYVAAVGQIAKDGSAKLVGGSVQLQGATGDFDIVRLSLYAMSQVSEEAVYTFNTQPSEFPLSLSGGASSSVKSMDADRYPMLSDRVAGTVKLVKKAAVKASHYEKVAASAYAPSHYSIRIKK